MRFENISEKQMIEDLTTEQREAIFTAAENDLVTEIRNGGLGSTTKK